MKRKMKISVDVLMAAGMLFMSGYHLWGDIAHEWVGAGIFALFIVHHILNLSFYKNLFKGKFSAYRITLIIIDFLVLSAMLDLMYGITISRHVFSKDIRSSFGSLNEHLSKKFWLLHIELYSDLLLRYPYSLIYPSISLKFFQLKQVANL